MEKLLPNVVREMVTANDEHWYPSPKSKDLYYPSVTTILSIFPKGVGFSMYLAGQASWESSQANLKQAGERGKKIHTATELLEKGETLERTYYTLEEWEMLMGFVAWHREYKPELVDMEYQMVSDKYKTGGTLDRVYRINGILELLDIKTSGSIYDSYWLQVAAYAKMYEAKKKLKIDRVSILRLTDRRKSRYEYVVQSEWKPYFDMFLNQQETWNFLNPNAKGPKVIEVPETLSIV